MAAKPGKAGKRERAAPVPDEPAMTVRPSFFERRGTLVALGLLAAFSLMTHHAILYNGFINFDDPHVVVGGIGGMSSLGEELRKVVRMPLTAMPVRSLAFALTACCLGKEPAWFHGASLLFHTAAGLVLFFLVRRILRHIGLFTGEESRRRDVAFLTSLLFLIHPINCNAVAWATCLKENLCAFFSFIGFLYYIKAEERSGRRTLHYAGAAFFFFLALGAKPVAVVLPAMFLTFSLLRLQGRGFWERIRKTCYHLLLGGAFFALFVLFQYQWMSVFVSKAREEIYTRILSVFYALFVYARNFAAPFWLNVRYPDVAVTSLAQDIRVMAAVSGIAALLSFSVLRFKKDALPLFGLCWFLIFLAPTSGIIPIDTTVADRYVYVAGVGVFLLFAYHLVLLLARRPGRPAMKTAAVVAMVLLAAGLGGLSFMRDRIWANDLTLWSDSLQKTPGNWIAHNNLSHYYFLQKDFDTALKHAQMSYNLNPDEPGALRNVVLNALHVGDYGRAREAGKRVLDMVKEPWAVDYNRLGLACQGLGDEKTALVFFRKAVEKDEGFSSGLENLTALYIKNGEFDQAYPYLKQMLAVSPDRVEVLEKIAPIAGKLGHYEDARIYYERLRSRRPEDMGVRINLMALAFHEGRYDRAVKLAEQALKELKAEEKPQYFFLTKGYQVSGLIALERPREAMAALRQALGYARETGNMREINNIRSSMERLAKRIESTGPTKNPAPFSR